jgi:hypothetical protein
LPPWVHDTASRRGDADFELLDLQDHPLPHFNEPVPVLVENAAIQFDLGGRAVR